MQERREQRRGKEKSIGEYRYQIFNNSFLSAIKRRGNMEVQFQWRFHYQKKEVKFDQVLVIYAIIWISIIWNQCTTSSMKYCLSVRLYSFPYVRVSLRHFFWFPFRMRTDKHWFSLSQKRSTLISESESSQYYSLSNTKGWGRAVI